MKRIVVDTSILIEFLREENQLTIYEQILDKGLSPVISFITVAELYAGKSVWEDPKIKSMVTKLISGTTIVYPDFETIQKAGQIRAVYQISLLDCFIAAVALEENIPLITLNKKDFQLIKGLKLF